MIDRVLVKGKSIPLELFELRHKFSPENFDQIAREYSVAFALYQNGKFPAAEKCFRALSNYDKPSAALAQRCAEFATDPPEEWQGIFVMPTK